MFHLAEGIKPQWPKQYWVMLSAGHCTATSDDSCAEAWPWLVSMISKPIFHSSYFSHENIPPYILPGNANKHLVENLQKSSTEDKVGWFFFLIILKVWGKCQASHMSPTSVFDTCPQHKCLSIKAPLIRRNISDNSQIKTPKTETQTSQWFLILLSRLKM